MRWIDRYRRYRLIRRAPWVRDRPRRCNAWGRGDGGAFVKGGGSSLIDMDGGILIAAAFARLGVGGAVEFARGDEWNTEESPDTDGAGFDRVEL